MSTARRRLLALFSFALAISAVLVRLYSTDPAGQAAASSLSGDPSRTVALCREALRRDAASPYRWADLAEAFAAAGRIDDAGRSFDRALVLAPAVPQIWVRHANFLFLQNQPGLALRSAVRVLDTVPDFDAVLFNYFDQTYPHPAEIAAAIEHNPRALRSWFAHLINVDNRDAARLAWKRIVSGGADAAPAVFAYTDYLLRTQAWSEAVSAWSEWLGPRRGDYPGRNQVFNGNFASHPTGGALDWHIDKDAEFFETVRENNAACIRFEGKANVDYHHLWQTVVLPTPARYRLSARIKSDGITTNEGPRLAITDLNLQTDSVTGTHDWAPVAIDFAVAQPRSIRIAIIRGPSRKFDNKITGTVWISDIQLTGVR